MERAAGIILVRSSKVGPEVLCLRIYDNYDLPKGGIEGNESELDAALRETQEETDVNDITFPWGYVHTIIKHPKRDKQVTLFLGSTKQVPKIVKNPKSGKFEHHSVKWLSLDQATQQVHAYLRPAIAWAKKQIAQGDLKAFIESVSIDNA